MNGDLLQLFLRLRQRRSAVFLTSLFCCFLKHHSRTTRIKKISLIVHSRFFIYDSLHHILAQCTQWAIISQKVSTLNHVKKPWMIKRGLWPNVKVLKWGSFLPSILSSSEKWDSFIDQSDQWFEFWIYSKLDEMNLYHSALQRWLF